MERPQRVEIHRDKMIKETECKDCDGAGRIMRIVSCCQNGCPRCSGDKYVINPVWKKYRKDPIVTETNFQCSICLDEVEVGDEKYVLHCRHEFHPSCIFRWMRESKKCPVCRQHDFYLEGEVFGSVEQPRQGRFNFAPPGMQQPLY